MSLTPGTRLGSYEITAAIGAGGMGEVYRARDTKLNRDVAIKVLPEIFTEDPDRLARFTREAQILAALSHPNIAHVHGLEELPNHASALVMELVDGDDLSAMIARGPIPIAEALPIARQIAEALEAAHEQGIVHRDLKPANIKVRADGTVKVLDFGLARGLEPAASSVDAMRSPTLTARATQMGVILGTAAYMAPEQARGKVVDKRADIWAFGVVLYEMVTGRRAFGGEEISDVFAAVLRQDIEWTALPSDTPPRIRRLLERCLERDVRQRLRDIGEARVLLSSPQPETPAAPPALPPARAGWTSALAWLAAGAVVGAALWASLARPAAPAAGDAPPAVTLKRLTQDPGAEMQPAMSPDGRQVLYTSEVAGRRNLYLLRVGGARAINLTGNSDSDSEQGRFSPSGEQIAFRSSRDGGGLFVMGATGESVRRLTTAGYDPAWSPDGRFIAYAMEAVFDPYSRSIFSELWTVEVATGKATRLYAVDAVQPAWSPDGSRIAFWANTGGQRDIWTIAATGGEAHRVTNDAATDWSPEWSPDGRWLYFASDRGGNMNLWRIAIDQSSGTPGGDPQPITNGTRPLGYARFSADGARMVVMSYDVSIDLGVAAFDSARPADIVPRTTFRNQPLKSCDPSPDGLLIACYIDGLQEDLVVLRADGAETRRITDDAFKDRSPTWSPDGKTLAFYSTRSGRWEDWAIQADGSGLRQLTNLDKDIGSAAWAPDGKSAIVGSASTHGTWRIDTTRLNTPESAQALPAASAAHFYDIYQVSPSGTLVAGLAYTTATSGVPAIWNLSSGTAQLLAVPGAEFSNVSMSFLPDSRQVLLTAGRELSLVDLLGARRQVLRKIDAGEQYRLSRDGKTVLIQHPRFDSDVWLLEMTKR